MINPKRRQRIVLGAVAGGVLLLAGAGGAYLFLLNRDHVARAAQYERSGDLRAAQLELRTATRRDARDVRAHLALARVQMSLFDGAAAEKELKLARSLGADRWDIVPSLAAAYAMQGSWSAVLAETPRTGPSTAITAKLLLNRGVAQIETRDMVAARETLATAQRAAPAAAETKLLAARIAFAGDDAALALTQIDEALKADPNQVDALLMKGRLLLAAGDMPGARAAVTRAVEGAPFSPHARLDRANLALMEGRDDQARADLAVAQEGFPRYARVLYLNAVLLARAGKYADATTVFDQLRPVIDQFPRANYLQALIAMNLGNVESAVDLARRFHTRFPRDLDGIRLLARTELAARRPERAAALLRPLVEGGQTDAATLDTLGLAYAALGDKSGAARMLQQAASLAPRDAGIVTHLGLAQLARGELGLGAATLDRSLQLDIVQPVATEALIATAIDAGDFDRAQTALARLRAQEGETERTGVLAATLLLARSDVEGARAGFTNLVRKYPDSIEAKVNLAKALILLDRRADGEALLRETLAKKPASLQAVTAYLQYVLQSGQFPAAIRALEAAVAAAPNDPLLAAMLSDMLVRSGAAVRAVALLEKRRDVAELPAILLGALARAQAASGMKDQAKASYAAQLKASPTDLEARRALVELLLRDKAFEAANQLMREGLALMPGTYGIMSALIGVEAQNAGLDPALAVAAGLRADPANLPASRLLKGDLLMQLRKYPEALQTFQEEAAEANTAELAQRVATANIAVGQEDAAAAVLRQWLADHPGDGVPRRILAQLDVKAKRWDAAQANLEGVLAANKDDVVALNNLAWIYQLKRDARARGLAQRAYLQAPTPQTADTLGWIMVQQNEAGAAVPLLQQAIRGPAANPTFVYHLAVALSKSGKVGEAGALLKTLLATSQEFEERGDAEKLLASVAGSPG